MRSSSSGLLISALSPAHHGTPVRDVVLYLIINDSDTAPGIEPQLITIAPGVELYVISRGSVPGVVLELVKSGIGWDGQDRSTSAPYLHYRGGHDGGGIGPVFIHLSSAGFTPAQGSEVLLEVLSDTTQGP